MTKQPSPGAGYRWVKFREIVSDLDEIELWRGNWVLVPRYRIGNPCPYRRTYRRRTTARKAAKATKQRKPALTKE